MRVHEQLSPARLRCCICMWLQRVLRLCCAYDRSGGRLSARCLRASCGRWPPPMPWELGVDVGSLDATLHLGFPGMCTSLPMPA